MERNRVVCVRLKKPDLRFRKEAGRGARELRHYPVEYMSMNFSRSRLRGDSPQWNAPVLDRRHWPRRETPFAEAAVTWQEHRAECRIEARIVNLSHGGAGLIVPVVPPDDAILHLVLAEPQGGVVVEGWTVATRADPDTGWFFLHMKFSHGCPEHVLERILTDSTGD